MTIKKILIKELGSFLGKTTTAGVIGSLFGSHGADDPSTSAASSAWKEIEQKLQGLFSHTEEFDRKARLDKKKRAGVGALLVFLVVFLLGRRSGRRTTTVLEVHKA